MEMITHGIVIMCISVLVIGFLKLFKEPMKFILKILLNTVFGYICLGIINFIGSFIGVSIGINLFNAVIVGIFGIPGVAGLLILQWILLI